MYFIAVIVVIPSMETQESNTDGKSEMMDGSLRRNANAAHLNAKDDGLLNSEVFEFAVQGISITSVSILGLFANSICLLVMSRSALKKGQCSSVNALLTSMAAVDIIVLICR